MFSFIHAADIHLDSALRGLARHENAPVDTVRGATREALRGLVGLAREQAVDFVLISGDLYDGDWPDYNTGLFFAAQMAQLDAANIPVMLIAGNHDAHSQITRRLRLPANVHLFGADAPETHELKDLRVAIHGQSFATRAVTENLALKYPAPVPGVFNIGLLHTALDGRAGHDPYAPCTLEDLTALGYDYWALGHVHTREILHESPPIVFPGNTQGRHIRETGPKGCYLVRAGGHKPCSLEFHPLDVVRWAELTVDLTGLHREGEALDCCRASLDAALEEAGGRVLAARVVFTGTTPLHAVLRGDLDRLTAEVCALALAGGGEAIWVEQVSLKTQPARETAQETTLETGPIAELAAYMAALDDDAAAVVTFSQALEPLARRLPGELRREPDPLDLVGGDAVRAVLADALPLLQSRLQAEGK